MSKTYNNYIRDLRAAIDVGSPKQWAELFGRYGTHWVSSVAVGTGLYARQPVCTCSNFNTFNKYCDFEAMAEGEYTLIGKIYLRRSQKAAESKAREYASKFSASTDSSDPLPGGQMPNIGVLNYNDDKDEFLYGACTVVTGANNDDGTPRAVHDECAAVVNAGSTCVEKVYQSSTTRPVVAEVRVRPLYEIQADGLELTPGEVHSVRAAIATYVAQRREVGVPASGDYEFACGLQLASAPRTRPASLITLFVGTAVAALLPRLLADRA